MVAYKYINCGYGPHLFFVFLFFCISPRPLCALGEQKGGVAVLFCEFFFVLFIALPPPRPQQFNVVGARVGDEPTMAFFLYLLVPLLFFSYHTLGARHIASDNLGVAVSDRSFFVFLLSFQPRLHVFYTH